MGETAIRAQVTGLIPMARTADVERSVDFHKLLGMSSPKHLAGDLAAGSPRERGRGTDV